MHERKSESEVAQLCLTLSDPVDRSLPGSSIHGIFKARVLEWGAVAFSATEYYWALKKKEILSFTTTWMNLKGIMLIEIISQDSETQILHHLIYMWNLK